MFGKGNSDETGIKAQTFEISAKRGVGVLQRKIRKWLAAHPDIEIISTDFAGFGDSIGYVILFRGVEVEVPDTVEDEPLQHGRLDANFDQGMPAGIHMAGGMQQQPPQQQTRSLQQNAAFGGQQPPQRQPLKRTQPLLQQAPQPQPVQPVQQETQQVAGRIIEEPVAKKPFRLGPGKTPSLRTAPDPIQAAPQPAPVAPQVEQTAEPQQPQGQQGAPRRSGFTTGAVFGNFDAFKGDE